MIAGRVEEVGHELLCVEPERGRAAGPQLAFGDLVGTEQQPLVVVVRIEWAGPGQRPERRLGNVAQLENGLQQHPAKVQQQRFDHGLCVSNVLNFGYVRRAWPGRRSPLLR